MIATGIVIGVTFFQMITLFLQFDINWPPYLTGWMNFSFVWFDVGSLNFPELMLSPECDWSMDYSMKWYMIVSFPLIVFIIFSTLYFYSSYKYQNPRDVRAMQDKCVQSGFTVFN